MENFKNWYQEQEIVEEGLLNFLGKLLGFTTAGAGITWMASLIVKNLASIKGVTPNFNKQEFRKATQENKAVKAQIVKNVQETNKYADDLRYVFEALNNDDIDAATKAFKELDYNLQNSVEVKRTIVAEITKKYSPIITAQPTPGSKSFQVIRAIFGLPVAKALANEFQETVKKYMSQE